MPLPVKTARKVGSAWKILAPAKLNLYLEVLGPRADGFHELETLMVPVRVYDELVYRPNLGGPLTLSVNLKSSLVEDDLTNDDNLVLRAARHLANFANFVPHGKFQLTKRIPVQAGMGGGSSDAAAALVLANEAWKLGYSHDQLRPLAADLGSDVPFFVDSCAAICHGRGEQIQPIHRMPKLHFVIAKPPAGLSTPAVFRQVAEVSEFSAATVANSSKQLAELLEWLRSGAIAQAGRRMFNRLELAAMHLAPWLTEIRELFGRIGCHARLMTGSGSAYVGVMKSARHARWAVGWLNNLNRGAYANLGHVFATSSC